MASAAPVVHPLAAAPDLLALHAADPQRFFCLLNSGAHAERTGRYDNTIFMLVSDNGGAAEAGQAGQ